jgi:hypothetical protein
VYTPFAAIGKGVASFEKGVSAVETGVARVGKDVAAVETGVGVNFNGF